MLERAVASVTAQTYPHWEAIIVDDGSTDATPQVAARLAGQDPRVRAVRQANGGPGVARETGRQLAQGEYLQYLDSDDVLLPRKFADQVELFERDSLLDIVYGATRLVDAAGRVLAAPSKGSGNDHAALFPHLLVERWWNTHTPLYRRSLCDRIGPWAALRLGEDWDYDARAGALKARLGNCRRYVSHHTHHPEARLTGGRLTREKLRDVAALLMTLARCGVEAGVPEGAAEWGVFRRWVFLEVRRTAAAGLRDESAQLLGWLHRQHDKALAGRLRLYAGLRRVVGPRVASWACDAAARLRDGGR